MLDNFAARVHNGRRYAPEYSGKGEKTEARSTLSPPYPFHETNLPLGCASASQRL